VAAATPSRIRVAAIVAGCLVLALLAAELGARIVLGERLLYRADPEIEYLPLPNQAVVQRGVAMHTNAWGMRSGAVETEKPHDAFRVLVIGDSIVFGHTNIPHDELATTTLSAMRTSDGKRVEALNVSASSWGPGNMLAWLDRFGTFEADAIVLVLSTHDLDDNRTYLTLDNYRLPESAPVSVLAEWVSRQAKIEATAYSDPRTPGDAERALPVLLARAARGCLVVHPEIEELGEADATEEERELKAAAEAAGLSVVMGRGFVAVGDDYLDDIHLTAGGQRKLMRALLSCPALSGIVADT
jgi:hypothetical protein